jgi:uncharacterized repeat protein (TIGR03809 family)
MAARPLPFDDVSARWHSLAERRRAHFRELYESGRWRLYYTEEQFRNRVREVAEAAEAWAQIAARKTTRQGS